MITFPEDPVQQIFNRVHDFGLTLMDETVTISAGMNTPNQIVTTPLKFESVHEVDIRRRVKQYHVALAKKQAEQAARSLARLVEWTNNFRAILIAAKRV